MTKHKEREWFSVRESAFQCVYIWLLWQLQPYLWEPDRSSWYSLLSIFFQDLTKHFSKGGIGLWDFLQAPSSIVAHILKSRGLWLGFRKSIFQLGYLLVLCPGVLQSSWKCGLQHNPAGTHNWVHINGYLPGLMAWLHSSQFPDRCCVLIRMPDGINTAGIFLKSEDTRDTMPKTTIEAEYLATNKQKIIKFAKFCP